MHTHTHKDSPPRINVSTPSQQVFSQRARANTEVRMHARQLERQGAPGVVPLPLAAGWIHQWVRVRVERGGGWEDEMVTITISVRGCRCEGE